MCSAQLIQSEISDAIEGTNFTITGNKSNVLRTEYDNNVDGHDDFFEAYLDALVQAVEAGVLSNPELIETLDRIYEMTIADDLSV